MITVYIKWII